MNLEYNVIEIKYESWRDEECFVVKNSSIAVSLELFYNKFGRSDETVVLFLITF